jgi:hypothetical protein
MRSVAVRSSWLPAGRLDRAHTSVRRSDLEHDGRKGSRNRTLRTWAGLPDGDLYARVAVRLALEAC